MLLRGWCAATTLLLSNPHRCCILRPPRRIGSAAFSAAPPSPRDREAMEKKNDQNGDRDDDDHKKKDTMWHSFGAGYGTRSDEEGFGGTYGGNDPLENPGHHANHPEYDKSQGSEVKEKEKGRNLTDEASATSLSHNQGAPATATVKKS